MFGHDQSVVELSEIESLSGEGNDTTVEDELCWQATQQATHDEWSEPDRHLLPSDLESVLPGPYLAAIVASIDRSRLNGHDVVRLMQAEARLASSYEAHKLSSVAELAHCPSGGPESPVERSEHEIEYAAVEVATALTLTRRAAERELDLAMSLRDRLGRVWDRFAKGALSFRKVGEFVRELSHRSQLVVDEVLDRSLDQATDLTTGQLRARLQRQLMIADPDGADAAMQEGLEDRSVSSYANPDYTAGLSISNADPIRVTEAMSNLDALARAVSDPTDPRTIDQLRADIALDLLAGRPTEAKGSVHLTVPAATLARLSDEPGHLGGYGPVIADIARQVAPSLTAGEWTFQVTDPDGETVATGTTRRRPTKAQTRRARAEYSTCTFIGCRAPAYRCDLDHRNPVSEGGPTHNDNLGPLCRHHHMVRHHTRWVLKRLPEGDHEWTSPLGHTYVKRRGPPES